MIRYRHSLCAQERQLVPIATLKNNPVILDVKEPASPQSKRIPPFENCPVTVFKNILDDAYHFRSGEPVGEHLPDRVSAFDGRLGYLVVQRMLAVERCKGVDIRPVEGIHPLYDEVFWFHGERIIPQVL